MRYRSITYIILLVLCVFTAGSALAQDTAKTRTSSTIDSAMAISPDYLHTRYAPFPTINFQPIVYQEIDTSMVHISEYDPLVKVQNLYQSLGINGQAHRSMVFDIDHSLGFTMITMPYPLYFKKMQDLKLYDMATSYTDINFTWGWRRELVFSATHAQRIRQVDFVVNIDACSNPGYFIHQNVNRLNVNAFVKYETPNKIYGLLAAYNLNHGKFAENGGLESCSDFTDRDPRDSALTYDLTSFAVMFSNAQTLINTHTAQLTNYVNIKNKKGNYFGTISHTLDIDNLKSVFTDHDLNNLFYLNRYYINPDTTNDSIQYFLIANTLQWSNYSPTDTLGDKAYFFRISGGLHLLLVFRVQRLRCHGEGGIPFQHQQEATPPAGTRSHFHALRARLYLLPLLWQQQRMVEDFEKAECFQGQCLLDDSRLFIALQLHQCRQICLFEQQF